MRSQRTPQSVMLGYPIEQVQDFDAADLPAALRYEVLCPNSGAVLGSHANLHDAQQFVVTQELERVPMRYRNRVDTLAA